MTSNDRYTEIWESLRDPEYRGEFVAEEINVGLAFQIRALRDHKKWNQSDLAKELKRDQPLISAWENPNYGSYTLATLKSLAKAFDVGLLVRFVPFSTLVSSAVDIKPDTLAPASFGEEESRNLFMTDLEKVAVDANQTWATPENEEAKKEGELLHA